MALGRSKLTKQGRISVPAAVRDKRDGQIVVRHAKFTSDDIHRALVPDGPPKPHTIGEMTRGNGSTFWSATREAVSSNTAFGCRH
jgi:hypothetical protein